MIYIVRLIYQVLNKSYFYNNTAIRASIIYDNGD
jgi:hypothetical protein